MSGLEPGTRVDGHYVIEAVAGRGGMGVVYRAHDEELDRRVALKVAAESLADLPEFRAGLLREARLTAGVDHPAVVGVHHVGELDGRPYVALQWIEGSDLRSRLAAGPLPVNEALEVLEQLAAALDAAHAVGCLHRDVKPANVLVRDTPQGLRASLTDFGVAGALQDAGAQAAASDLVGTPAYLAPELAHGAAGDARSDLYGLACVAFELFTGTPPFVAATVPAMLVAHAIRARPVASGRRPELPHELDPVLVRAMAIDPGERYASGTDFVAALHAALDLAPGGVPAAGLRPALRRARRHLDARPGLRRTLLAVAALLLFALALGTAALVANATKGSGPINHEGPRLARGPVTPTLALDQDPPGDAPTPLPLPDEESRDAVVGLFTEYAEANARKSVKDLNSILGGIPDGQIWGHDGVCRENSDSVPPGYVPPKKGGGFIAIHQYLWQHGEAPVKLLGLTPASLEIRDVGVVAWKGDFEDARGQIRDVRLFAQRTDARYPWELFYVNFCPDITPKVQ